MDIKEVIEDMGLRFKSGNDVPVTRATITMEQWEAVKAGLDMTEHKKRIACLDLFSDKDFDEMRKHQSATKMIAMANMEMTEERAREILGDKIHADNVLFLYEGEFVSWLAGDVFAELDGEYTADELEAIAWWMRNKGGEDGTRNTERTE